MTTDLSALGLGIKRLQVRHQRLADERLRPLGISIVQWDALRHLHENPGISLHQLAQLTFQTDQSCGALTSRMIEHGLIERRPGAGRAVRHGLTERGEKLRRAAGDVMQGVLEESFAPLTDEEREQFSRLLKRLL